ncbi:MAG: hypothetical protein FJY88_04200 [Candidatus Eisenbacteria bacterium]|nr:hypothetical protein [Candidatus Eisenbacteria bacterium]
MRASWPDRIRIQARAGLFVPIVTLAVREDSAFVSLPRAGAFWSGGADAFDGSLAVPGAGELLSILCPVALIERIADPHLERTPSGWTLLGRLGEGEPLSWVEVRLSNDCARITEILWRNHEGEIVLRARRFGARRVGTARVPDRIRLESQGAKESIEIRLLGPREDPEQPADLFRISAGPGQRVVDEAQLREIVGVALSP